ncbi:MAG: hypothetical protein KAH44_09245, partial [Oricola sp.]|nr:hypothetical protein [Oricola sp.]
TVERAMAAQPAKQPDLFTPVSMKVGVSGAYFQPGIRVGAAALPGAPEEPVVPGALKLPKERPSSEAAPVQIDERALASKPKAAEPETLGDLHEETAGDAAPATRPRRRKKNFLARKYRLMPTHFWPKSWKRAWRRRAAMKAEMRAERRSEPQAAE